MTEFDCPDLEVDADCRNVALGVGIIGEPQQLAGLSHAGVTGREEFEQAIVPRLTTHWCSLFGIASLADRQIAPRGSLGHGRLVVVVVVDL